MTVTVDAHLISFARLLKNVSTIFGHKTASVSKNIDDFLFYPIQKP